MIEFAKDAYDEKVKLKADLAAARETISEYEYLLTKFSELTGTDKSNAYEALAAVDELRKLPNQLAVAREKNEGLREVVEWIDVFVDNQGYGDTWIKQCLLCKQTKEDGHAPDCQRQELKTLLDAAREENERLQGNRPFPICGSPGMTIPWSVAQQAYLGYAKDGGSGQSLERVAERGGFYVEELDKYHPGWQEHTRIKAENERLMVLLGAIHDRLVVDDKMTVRETIIYREILLEFELREEALK